MPKNKTNNGAFTPKRIGRSIKLDRVNPGDFNNYDLIYSCEQCSHFNPDTDSCTIGFQTFHHRRAQQLKTFYSNSHMAFCRFTEID